MACPDCSCSTPIASGNTDFHRPVKIGEPLSTACERAHIIGSIPEVVRHPAFTLVAGATVENCISNGGIANPSNFFKTRNTCYGSLDSRLAGSSCC